jgi:hypothetical protein
VADHFVCLVLPVEPVDDVANEVRVKVMNAGQVLVCAVISAFFVAWVFALKHGKGVPEDDEDTRW